MFVGITNTPRDYAWGSVGQISAVLGRTPTSATEAELWLGSHAGSPARILDPAAAGGATDLSQLPGLPFLLKVLAAASPLSLQAHPTDEQAAAGFARENAAGVPLDAPFRNYKDDSAKPELIYALSESFDALCGFRPAAELRASIVRLIELDAATPTPRPETLQHWLDRTSGDDSLRPVFEWLISRGELVDELVARVVQIARENPREFATVVSLADSYPGDPGIVISLMLHNVTLRRGEALYLPAGNIHAYLRGVGIELMQSSDNVLRGGLTPKHVDVPELMSVLDFTPGPVPYLRPHVAEHLEVFAPAARSLALAHVTGNVRLAPAGPAIVLCVAGTATLTGAASSATMARGEAVLVLDESELVIETSGELFVAASSL